MKTVTVKHPSGDWEIKVNVLTPKEREAALKKHGIDPKKSKVIRTPKNVPLQII